MTDRYRTLPSLTAGRGIAALMVAAFHGTLLWPGKLAPYLSCGWLGVTFFYVLSGFVLTWSFSDRRTYQEFMIHRIARIFPVHILCLIVSILCFLVFHAPFGGYIGTPVGTILQLFLVHDFVPGHPNIRQAWDGVSWSLSAEFFFYLFAPLIIRKLMQLQNHVLLNMGMLLFVAHFSIGATLHKLNAAKLYDFMVYHPIAYLPTFIYGIIGAILIQRGLRLKIGLTLKVALFLPIIVYCFVADDRDAITMIALSVPAFLAFILGEAGDDTEGKSSMLAHSIFEKIGEISYSLYMTHAILLAFMGYAVSKFNVPQYPTIFLVIFLLSSLVLAWLTFTFVEMPAKNHIISRFKAKAARKKVVTT